MKKILHINGNLLPPNAGDSIYSYGLLERLSKHYYVTTFTIVKTSSETHQQLSSSPNIKLVKINQSNSTSNKLYRAFVLGSVKQIYCREYMQHVKAEIQHNKYDYLLIDHLRMYSLYNKVKHYINKDCKIIYLAHNIEYHNFTENLSLIKSKINKLIELAANIKLKKIETSAINDCNILWTLTDKDLNVLSRLRKTQVESRVIPPYFKYNLINKSDLLPDSTIKLLLLGSMDWYPNVQGVHHFIKEIMPTLIKKSLKFRLYIVGRNPLPEIKKYQSKNVVVTGEVPNIDRYIEECDVLLLPNRLGTGIKVKVMEALMKGIPIIMYTENAVGYNTEIFRSPFVVNGTDDFINSILLFNENRTLGAEFVNKAGICFDEYRKFDFNL